MVAFVNKPQRPMEKELMNEPGKTLHPDKGKQQYTYYKDDAH